eukprot:CAMPEP_0198290454 /NCGR_PEP_ID=MMETSP1449-20131203/8320_1 /TAXON_ID=420275 /ORGANISM="Attheya septentrionalis, Strain CCMP2084" /LENGTH=377 /DNA_ID=CAMNT_0043988961 /DNA_START=34 /DNA_END=1167 /DNA_ORIENTATION=-
MATMTTVVPPNKDGSEAVDHPSTELNLEDASSSQNRPAKRQRVDDEKRVRSIAGSSSRSALSPFLPCHLAMLTSLYESSCGDGKCSNNMKDSNTTGNTIEEGSVDKEMWEMAKLFLKKRAVLLARKSEASSLRGIHMEAKHVMSSSQIVGEQRNNEMMTPLKCAPSSTPSSPWRSSGGTHHGPSFRPFFGSPMPSFISQSTTRSPHPYTNGGMMLSPYANDGGYLQHPHNDMSSSYGRMGFGRPDPQNNGNHHSHSWNLVTKLLGKKRVAAEQMAEQVLSPFRPLSQAVEQRVLQLRCMLRDLGNARLQERNKHLMIQQQVHPERPIDHQEDTSMMAPRSRNTPDSWLDEENRMTEIQMKLKLWYLLACSLKNVDGV